MACICHYYGLFYTEVIENEINEKIKRNNHAVGLQVTMLLDLSKNNL